jgi:hypothetical protein
MAGSAVCEHGRHWLCRHGRASPQGNNSPFLSFPILSSTFFSCLSLASPPLSSPRPLQALQKVEAAQAEALLSADTDSEDPNEDKEFAEAVHGSIRSARLLRDSRYESGRPQGAGLERWSQRACLIRQPTPLATQATAAFAPPAGEARGAQADEARADGGGESRLSAAHLTVTTPRAKTADMQHHLI